MTIELPSSTRQILVVIIYRPEPSPVPVSVFLNELGEYLEGVATTPELLVVCGDFNFHVNDDSDNNAKRFLELLDTFGLDQHVLGPTHISGNTLDLILSRRCESLVSGTFRASLLLSDHFFIDCKLNTPKPRSPKRTESFRKISQIDVEDFKADIRSSDICGPSKADLDDQVRVFDKTLVGILDKHAPLITREIPVCPSTPWYNGELRQLKQARRRAERKRHLSPACGRAYRRACNLYSVNLNKARRDYYTKRVQGCEGDSRKLFRLVHTLCQEKQVDTLPPHDDKTVLANNFGEFFVRKVKLIQEKIAAVEVNCPSVTSPAPGKTFSCFDPVSEVEVSNIILKASSASCELDPIPTSLLKQCLDSLLPTIVDIVNQSLQTGYIPDSWKCATVKPLLKKAGLDLTFANFRPVSNLPFISKAVERVVVKQLLGHSDSFAPLPKFQSAYRQNFSTETAMVKVQSDILMKMDKQEVCLLVLLDLSAVFDTVNVTNLLSIMKEDFGISGTVLKWLESYRCACMVY
ncbi:uncharacterized protein LOC135495242 [Lineus longissimus]|uniref:uncharacterized protein LOC135495242 n=1 Tax=Lineus longissimus TaxID=88925 RepID=UPI00315D7759